MRRGSDPAAALATGIGGEPVTTNGCMGSYAGIMPCLTLTLTNDDGYMADCESDSANIPAGILMHYIAGRPTCFCNPTFPHEGWSSLPTAPRRGAWAATSWSRSRFP